VAFRTTLARAPCGSRARSRSWNLRPPFRACSLARHHRPRDVRARKCSLGDLRELFLPSFGPGKIPAEAFFCHCFRKRCRRGGCWGCDVRPRLRGDLAGGGLATSASKRCGGGGAPWGGRRSLPRFVFLFISCP